MSPSDALAVERPLLTNRIAATMPMNAPEPIIIGNAARGSMPRRLKRTKVGPAADEVVKEARAFIAEIEQKK